MLTLRRLKSFYAAKTGVSPEESEDYFQLGGTAGSDATRVSCIAVCDGASESAFARNWAKILTEAYINHPLPLPVPDAAALIDWLKPAAEQWSRQVPWDNLPWHGVAKTKAGALAALVGLTVSPASDESGRLSWRAFAVGDSCLFIVRDQKLITRFPLEESSQFNSIPSLICSNPEHNADLWQTVLQADGEFQAGDLTLMASDAVAAWLLRESEAGGQPWEMLRTLEPDQWEDWLGEQRKIRALRNDDSTLVMAEVMVAE